MKGFTDIIREGERHREEKETSWTTVRRAKGDDTDARDARRELVVWASTYVFAQAVKRRRDPHAACDLAQTFLLRMLTEGLGVRNANPARGKFHAYLDRCLENFMKRNRRKAEASLDSLMEVGMEPVAPEESAAWDAGLPNEALRAEMLAVMQHELRRHPRVWKILLEWEFAGKGQRPGTMSMAAKKHGVTTRRYERLLELGKRAVRSVAARLAARMSRETE